MILGSVTMPRRLSSVIGPEKNARLKVSEAGLRAVLISHRSGRNTNPPIRTTDAQKNTRKPTVF